MNPRAPLVAHLFACWDALYRCLGEGAPHVTDDAYVVALNSASRNFGSVALGLREFLSSEVPAPLAVIERVLRDALARDATGALAIYATTMVVGPRLLVTLLDARAEADDDLRELLDRAAQVTVAELRALATVLHDQSELADPAWQTAARGLTELVEASGNAESFVLSR